MSQPLEDNLKFRQEYVFSIRSLYETRKPLRVGLVGYSAVFLLIYFSTMDVAYLMGVAATVAIWLGRTWDFSQFDREMAEGPMSYDRARQWEVRYIVGSTTAVLNMSLMAFYSFILDASVVAMVGTFGMSMSSLVAVVGRNFGSTRNINIMCAAICIPMSAGMILSGDIFLAAIGCACLPMISSTREMANLVRATVHKAWTSTNEVQVLADQFQTALDNMAHGLFMVNGDGRIAVANKKASELLKAVDVKCFEGRSLASLVRYGRRKGILPHDRAETIAEQCERLFSGASDRELIEMSIDSFFDVTSTLREGKGVVLSFEDATQRILSDREVTRLARFDALSGLPNRTWMAELITKGIDGMPRDGRIVFSVFDIDRFKQINDTMGHSSGDKVIQHVGARLNEFAKSDPRVVAARLGGDEFVMAVIGVRPGEDIDAILDSGYGHVVGTQVLHGKRIDVRVSGGVIVQDKASFVLDEALVKADLALYQSKKSDTTLWTVFEREMDESYRRKQKLTKDLRKALQEGGLSAAYQPMLTPDGREVRSCEVLARWMHPEMGFIPPPEFIGIAEEIGLVSEVTKHILRNACRDCMTWPDHMSVSVNLSVIDLSNPDIVVTIRNALEESGLPPQRLQVEITETMLANDMRKTRDIMASIRAMGVKTALDDFGTGYSSLSYLHEFPIDKVKIDRSFVVNVLTDEKAAAMLRGIMGMVTSIGFETVVEGIEDKEQLAKVRSLGNVGLVQGWVFGRPMAPEAVAPFIESVSGERRSVSREEGKVVRLKLPLTA